MPNIRQFWNASRRLKIGVFSLLTLCIGLVAAFQNAFAFPVGGEQTTLPVGTELNEDAIDLPREVFHSEMSGGRKSYIVNLGDLAFNAPDILGGAARQAGVPHRVLELIQQSAPPAHETALLLERTDAGASKFAARNSASGAGRPNR